MANHRKSPEEVSDLESVLLPEISEEDMLTVFGGLDQEIIVPTCGC